MALLVQSNNTTASSATTCACAFSSANTMGNLIVVLVSNAAASGTVSCADSLGNSYAVAASTVPNGYIFYALNSQSGSNTVTVTGTASLGWTELHIAEFNGLSFAAGLEAGNYTTGTSATPTSTAISTTVNGELIVALCANSGTAITVGASFTQIQNPGTCSEYQVQTTAGSISATFSQTSGVFYLMAAAFKPGSSRRMTMLGVGS